MAVSQANIVKYLRRKDPNANELSFDEPTYLGAEQRFVSTIRNGSARNLEEQILFGTDVYTTEETIENTIQNEESGTTTTTTTTHTISEYRTDGSNPFYKIEGYSNPQGLIGNVAIGVFYKQDNIIYMNIKDIDASRKYETINAYGNKRYYREDDGTLVLNAANKDQVYATDDDILYFDKDANVYSYDTETNTGIIVSNEAIITGLYYLSYGGDIIAQKVVTVETENDQTESSTLTKYVISEVIHLKEEADE